MKLSSRLWIMVVGILIGTPALFAADDWNASLDSARGVDYMTPVEKDVVFELNKVRSDPKRYAETYIKPRLAYFSGKTYAAPGQTPLMTQEGPVAVQACINTLSKASAVAALAVEKGICLAAGDLVRDQAGGKTGHYASDGSDPFTRMNRYGKWATTAGENVSYGPSTGREIVIQLLVDDGVPDRGHLKNIMDKAFGKTGVAIGPHKTYGTVCVMDFAGGYTTSAAAAAKPVAPSVTTPVVTVPVTPVTTQPATPPAKPVTTQPVTPVTPAPSAPAATFTLNVYNGSGETWTELYIISDQSVEWGRNLISASTMVPRETRTFTIERSATGSYDVKVVVMSGKTKLTAYYLRQLEKQPHAGSNYSVGLIGSILKAKNPTNKPN